MTALPARQSCSESPGKCCGAASSRVCESQSGVKFIHFDAVWLSLVGQYQSDSISISPAEKILPEVQFIIHDWFLAVQFSDNIATTTIVLIDLSFKLKDS